MVSIAFPGFFKLEMQNGRLYGSLIDILNRGAPVALLAIGMTVVIAGRPVARHLDDGWTLEVTRLCTDGTANACSKLYAAAGRAARALGYTRLITYTLPAEGGASLRAAGWRLVGQRGGGNWNRARRPRRDTPEALRVPKLLWEAP